MDTLFESNSYIDINDLKLKELDKKYRNNNPLDIDIIIIKIFLDWGMDGEDNFMQ